MGSDYLFINEKTGAGHTNRYTRGEVAEVFGKDAAEKLARGEVVRHGKDLVMSCFMAAYNQIQNARRAG
jgi:hypothetical protein